MLRLHSNGNSHLSITHAVPVHNDAIRKIAIILMVLSEGSSHTHLQVVGQFLASGLELALCVVPVE